MTQRCYNLGCFNDKASSVKWEGLPTTGAFNGQSRIAFFTGKECTGDSRDWPTDGVINDKEGNYPMDFSLDGINDAISSFMIWETSKKATNGQDLPCPWGLTLLLLLVVFTPVRATDIWFYNDDDYDKHKTFKRFNFGIAQRCYNIADCFDNKASSASWINAPKAAWLAFYDDEECRGTQYVSMSTPSGEMKFAPVGLDNKISSFMQWEYATFALKGFVDICNDAAILAVNATTNTTDASNDNDNSALNATISFY
ncbi:hypothetical protein PC129_g11541 [Phytophthora cactorum]|uniref:Uncharacterized protein n=1 Tax=Phytophthora cactorum TaxID=29920 RepID=A0A8T1FJ08_9STRA|nr:hypothetical protein Pcac1_g22036 [Phytophthora cactorum]KAG2853899.1 hypothetical protein PC113_g13774 [Phytophthora cactorum]KAG2898005.1 hypothetical protein PC114_g14450 [Phytophthora cactorum]KAG2910865.1 hypothetical protein PC115_g12769 [Phytophthora cactorum]KAG2929336.1 hypothetical protein PC117_g14037 [Phytophthora cactorum]